MCMQIRNECDTHDEKLLILPRYISLVKSISQKVSFFTPRILASTVAVLYDIIERKQVHGHGRIKICRMEA